MKCLRYQPTPAGRKPPALPVGLFLSNGPSILQSCGTSSFRQPASSKSGFSAPGASDLRKRQSLSKDVVTLTEDRATAEDPISNPTINSTRVRVGRNRVIFHFSFLILIFFISTVSGWSFFVISLYA